MKRIDVNAKTDVYCVFGNPVKHSLSPVMQNAAFAACGINAAYTAFGIQNIGAGINAMKELNIPGASVTIPFKQDAIKHVDVLDKTAERIGALNTLCNRDGKIYGFNTDASGAVKALENSGIALSGVKVLVLGNGGSARAVSFGLIEKGAFINIAGRNRNKIKTLADDLNKVSETGHFLFDELNNDILNGIDIIVNTTSVGMTPNVEGIPIDENYIQKKHVVFDIVYAPNTTSLLACAKKKGCRIVRGIDMLVNQGAAQFELWTGQKAPVNIMKKSLKKYIK